MKKKIVSALALVSALSLGMCGVAFAQQTTMTTPAVSGSTTTSTVTSTPMSPIAVQPTPLFSPFAFGGGFVNSPMVFGTTTGATIGTTTGGPFGTFGTFGIFSPFFGTSSVLTQAAPATTTTPTVTGVPGTMPGTTPTINSVGIVPAAVSGTGVTAPGATPNGTIGTGSTLSGTTLSGTSVNGGVAGTTSVRSGGLMSLLGLFFDPTLLDPFSAFFAIPVAPRSTAPSTTRTQPGR